MSSAALARALPPDFSLTLVDVGAAGGLHARWKPFRPFIRAVLFDPRESAGSGSLERGGARVFPTALGAEAGEGSLRITALPNMSSLLEPDLGLLRRYRRKGAHAEVVDRQTLRLERLDALEDAEGFATDVLKADTQGSELQVLEGAEGALGRSVLLAEVEVSFFPRYLGQPLFADVQAFLAKYGFEVIELHRLKRYRAANPLGVANIGLGRGQRAGRIAYGDAIFLRRDADLLARAGADGGATLLRAVIVLIAYGKPDLAARLFADGRDTLPGDVAARVESALRAFGRSRGGVRLLHTVVDWLSRKL